MDWFRLYGEFATDPKVQSMPEAMQRRLVMVFCLHSSNVLVTLQETDISFALRISDEELAETKELFVRKGFVDEDWNVRNWDKRQRPSDSSAPRVRAFRQRRKEESESARNVTVTDQKRIEEIREEEIKEESKTKTPRVPRFDAQAHLVSMGVDPKVSEDWLSLRKKKNLAATQTAFEGVLLEAGKAGMTMDQALRTCCTRGWGGFNADWMDKGNLQGGRSTARIQAISHKDESRAAAANSIGLGAQRHDDQLGYIDAECRFIA